MAKPNVFLLSVLLMASLFYISHTSTISGMQIDEVRIRGVVRCSLTGDPNAPPASNVTVYLVCGGANTTVGQAATDLLGAFVIVFNVAETLLINPSECSLDAYLPTGTCEIPIPDGTLSASVVFVSIIISGVLVIGNYAATTFLDEDGPPPP